MVSSGWMQVLCDWAMLLRPAFSATLQTRTDFLPSLPRSVGEGCTQRKEVWISRMGYAALVALGNLANNGTIHTA
jgi:hypothetical protein